MTPLSTMDAQREQALQCLASLPPFSPVLNRLLAELSSDYVPLATVAATMERDTVIAGNIIRIVNSAAYGRRVEVTSLSHAASLLGIDRLRNAILGMSVSRLWNHVRTPRSFSMARFNLHGVGVAIMSDLLAQHLPVENPEGAFLAGLFHDLGLLLIAVGLPQAYDEILALHKATGHSWSVCEQEVLGFSHCQISAAACDRWKLPEYVGLAALHHNDTNLMDAPPPYPLGATVHIADTFVNTIGVTLDPKPLTPTEEAVPLFDAIGLAEDGPSIVREFETQFKPIASLFH